MKTKKILLAATLVLAGSMITTSGHSQVYVSAHVGFGLPAPRVYVAPRPAPVVYAPVAPACEEGYGSAAIYENDFPGYAYYDYPVWNGHYRDRFYYEHYRPYFERDHRDFFRNGRFDRDRFERERVSRERSTRGVDGYAYNRHDNRNGHDGRGHDNRGGRGWDHNR